MDAEKAINAARAKELERVKREEALRAAHAEAKEKEKTAKAEAKAKEKEEKRERGSTISQEVAPKAPPRPTRSATVSSPPAAESTTRTRGSTVSSGGGILSKLFGKSALPVEEFKAKYGSAPQTVIALHPFTAEQFGDLQFNKDDVITVTKSPPGAWWEGAVGARRGKFPTSYVAVPPEETKRCEEERKAREKAEKEREKAEKEREKEREKAQKEREKAQKDRSSAFKKSEADRAKVVARAAPSAAKEQVLAVHDFAGAEKGDLKFSKGEVITIIAKDGDFWWTGETKKGKRGKFPTNYVKPYVTASASTPAASSSTPSWKQPTPASSSSTPSWKQPTPAASSSTPSWKKPAPAATSAPAWQKPTPPTTSTSSWKKPTGSASSAPVNAAPSWKKPTGSTSSPKPVNAAPSWKKPTGSTSSSTPVNAAPSWKKPVGGSAPTTNFAKPVFSASQLPPSSSARKGSVNVPAAFRQGGGAPLNTFNGRTK